MDTNHLLTWIFVGLVAGVLASMVVRNGYGLVGDTVVGIVGAFLGDKIFHALRWHAPLTGMGGVIAVAFVGACVLLLLLRVVNKLDRPRR